MALGMQGGEILDVIAGSLPVDKVNYVISQDGMLQFSWNSVDNSSAKPDEILFSLIVVSGTDGSLLDMLHIRQELMHAEAYIGEELNVQDVDIEITSPVLAPDQNRLFQNEPNPFSASTTVRFQLEHSGEATIRIIDLSGRLITVKKGEFAKGVNAIELTKTELGISNGVLICQLQAGGFVATQRMIIVKQ